MNTIQRIPETYRIFLSPVQNRLIGSYPASAKRIHVICDSSTSPFTVELPPLGISEEQEFTFYNIPLSGSGNYVDITAARSMEINKTDFVKRIIPGEAMLFVDTLKSYWVTK